MPARKATVSFLFVFVASACSSSPDIEVTFDQPPTPTPTATAAPTSTPTAQPTLVPTATPAATAQPRSPVVSGSVVYRSEAGLIRLDADGTTVRLQGDSEPVSSWVLEDRSVLGVGDGELTRWATDGSATTVDCPCSGAALLDGMIVAVGPTGRLYRFDTDLAPLDVIDSDLVGQLASRGALEVTGAAATGEVIVSGHRAGNPASAYGGPFTLWAIGADGQVRTLVDVDDANVGSNAFALSPDGASLAFTTGFRLGACAHLDAVWTVDLVTNEATQLPLVWEPLDDSDRGEEQLLSNLIWADDGIYVLAAIAQGPHGDFECGSLWPTALWHYDGVGWRVADDGPVTQVYPLDATTKAYVLSDIPGAPGPLYWEQGGEARELAPAATIVAALPAQLDVQLTPPSALSPAARATYASMVAAAASGSTRNLAEAAGNGFAFSTDPEVEGDPAAFWDDLNQCCEVDVPSVVWALLTRAPLSIVTIDGQPLWSWAEPLDNGWRVAIDDAGNVWWIIQGVGS